MFLEIDGDVFLVGISWRIKKVVDNSYYVCSETIKKKLIHKKVYVFGTGVEAESLTKKTQDSINIVAYIDNFRFGSDKFFCGKSIYSLKDYLDIVDKYKVIVIATYRFGTKIEEQLISAELVKGDDFYFWDDANLFIQDSITTKYIEFLSKIWKEEKTCNSTAKIMVPFDNKHDTQPVVFAYFANYLAKKYNASVIAYLRMLMEKKDASPVLKKIYRAVNINEFIDYRLTDDQLERMENICKVLWEKLYTWKDWNEIIVYGIHFGTTFIRDYSRFFIPQFDLRNEYTYQFLKRAVSMVVFWYDYFNDNDVKVVILGDGVTTDGYIRDIAISKGIPCYTFGYMMERLCIDYYIGRPYRYFDKYWEQLTVDEQKKGIEWSKEHLKKRLQGSLDEVFSISKKNFTFALGKKSGHILEENDKLKVVIFPHIFEEDSYICGEHIFDNSYFEWLCHLGDLSEKTPDYDWYIKEHPDGRRKDFIILDMITNRYPKIKRISASVSPYQLRDEGVRYALTVCGTIGQEYPAIGIQVINAGYNPYNCYDFTWNPKNKEEYDEIILNLQNLKPKDDMEGLYRFYCLRYLYYEWAEDIFNDFFCDFSCLHINRLVAESIGKELGTWLYDKFMQEWTIEKHKKIMDGIEAVLQKLDDRKLDVLYRKRRTENVP